MNTRDQGSSRQQIYQRTDRIKTEQLLEIWRTGIREGWSGPAFDIVGEILRKRLGSIPPEVSSSIPRIYPPKIPWPMIAIGIGLVLILTVLIFSAPSTKQAAIFTTTLTSTITLSTSTGTPLPTLTPTQFAPPTETFALTATTNVPLGTLRPLTGVIKSNQGSGNGELTVENGTSRDGVVILTLSNNPVLAIYIRSGDSFTMRGIQDGTYHVYFSTGSDWNGKAFTTAPTYEKFEDALEFITGSTTYTTYSLTLQPVAGGNAATDSVDENEFPGIGG